MMRRKSVRNAVVRRFLVSDLAVAQTKYGQREVFDDVRRFCLFIGHGRSGSSLVGALLNAHKHVVMSNELNVFDYLSRGRTRDQILNLIYRTSARQARMGSKGGGGYTYAVPNQWQGRSDKPRVIGDRKAGATAILLFHDPELAHRLRRIVEMPLSFVSVVRNPFDALTTTLEKTIRQSGETESEHLQRQIDHYFERAAAIMYVLTEFGEDAVRFVHHDRLIRDPHSELAELCLFLDLPCDEDYLRDCASIIRPKANLTRWRIDWPRELIEQVESKASAIPWLESYRYDESAEN